MMSGFPTLGRFCIGALIVASSTALGNVPAGRGDDLGRPLSVSTDSDGGARSVRQTTQYNERGQVAWTEDGENHRTAFVYDAAGRQTAVTNALGQVTTTLYESIGVTSRHSSSELTWGFGCGCLCAWQGLYALMLRVVGIM